MRDALTKAQHQDILNKLESGEISRGRGLHQSSSLTRPEILDEVHIMLRYFVWIKYDPPS